MAQQNRLYVWDDRFLYLTAGIVSGLTQRHTVTLLVSLGDRGFELGDAQGHRQRFAAALLGRRPVRSMILMPDRVDQEAVRAAGEGRLEPAGLFRLTTALPRALSGYRPIRLPMDMRVSHIAQKIKKELPLTSTLEQLGAEVGLSAHRLRHLFSDKLGISIKSYTLWRACAGRWS